MDMPNLLKAVEKVDDMTVKFVLNEPEAPFLANLAMDFASIFSAEYAAADAGGRHARAGRSAIRSAPARSSWSPTRRMR